MGRNGVIMTKAISTEELVRFAPGLKSLLVGTASVFALALAPAFAQETQPADDDVELVEEEADDEDSKDTLVVTGSRVRRDTFSSISPLQVITTEQSLDVGLIDPASILQQSEAAAGQQIDSTFQGFVLDNGPGSETINLRGLGAGRTLVLINGRRLAPAGVEGAPTQPSINLIPGSLVERYDLLLDGASSIYGSDAVAGVGNIILRKDFEGLEIFASGDYAQQGAGHDYTLSAAWGKNTDRGFFGIGAEYDYQDEVTLGDRDFLAGCDTHYEITEDGDIRTVDVASALINERNTGGLVSQRQSPCKAAGVAGRFLEQGSPRPRFSNAFFTPGTSNFGVNNFSVRTLFSVPVDADGDGFEDVYLPDYAINGNDLERSFFNEQKQVSVMAYGEYTFEGSLNLTPYFEALWVRNEIFADSGAPQLFPFVPARNPFNPCFSTALGGSGVDCGLAENNIYNNPNYLNAFRFFYFDGPGSSQPGARCSTAPAGAISRANCVPATFGLLAPGAGIGPVNTQAVVAVAGDRENVTVELEQLRGVAGFRMDLPFLNAGPLNDWQFDASVVYSKSEGVSARRGIRDDRLAFALGWDPTVDQSGDGGTNDVTTNALATLRLLPGGPCDAAGVLNPALLSADVSTGCVAVNLFAPSLYEGIQGSFASAAEADYLFDSRDFNTEYTQTIFSAFVSGDLFRLPAGEVAMVLGAEYRTDEINSIPDDIAAQGLFFGFFSDLGAVGEKYTQEAFAELDIPLLANKPLAKQLDVNVSGRYTEDEFYGGAYTYSLKAGWRPVDSLLLKASTGTSFRAPNLRENFILGQSGFNTLFDPCAVPADAIQAVVGGGFLYSASLDTRDQTVLDNCTREGRDPTSVGFDATTGQILQFVSTEINTGGATDITEETSRSYTAGFSFEQPWFDGFDLNIGVSYYDIEIEDSIIEPSGQFIVNDCFLRETGGRSTFCDRIEFNGTRDTINFVDAGFLNQDKETVAGIDYNLSFSREFTAFDQPMDFGFNLRANQLKERATIFVGDDLSVSQDDFVGEFGFPEWTATATYTLDVSDYRFTWQTRFIDAVAQDPAGVDPFSDAFNSLGNGFVSDTCGGPNVGDVLCADVGFADEYYVHAASIRYAGDTWTIRAGINNVFDTAPPKVDSSEVFAISNTPIGNGYDLDGRQFFISIDKDFQ